MTFLHVTLLAGMALASIPIVIHLSSKKPPQKLIFPALRFVRETVISAEKGWKAKHWLLLALRALLVLILAFALAAPRVHSAMLASYLSIGMIALLALLATAAALVAYASNRSSSIFYGVSLTALALWGLAIVWGTMAITQGKVPLMQSTSGPIAAAILIDTGPTMDYRFNNQTRLEVAKEMGRWLIDRLPNESQIAIITDEQGLRLSTDRLTAERQLDRVQLEGKSTPIVNRLLAAIDLVRTSKLERREVYILSDLNRSAWQSKENRSVEAALAMEPNVLVQLIDVGVEKTQNWSLVEPKLSQQIVTPGGSVDLSVEILASTQAPDQQITLELLAEPVTKELPMQRNGKTILPEAKVIERQILELGAGGSSSARFTLRNLEEGTHQLQLRLGHPDPLEIDNVAFAAVEVRQRGKVLIVCDQSDQARELMLILDPTLDSSDLKSSRCDRADTFRLDTIDFEGYSSIVFLDPTPLTAALVDKLGSFVEKGGGILFLLGPNLLNVNLQEAPIAKLLPGTVRLSQDRSLFFVPSQPSHPVFHPFENTVEIAPWVRYPIDRHWEIDPPNDRALVLMRYTSSNLPAILDEPRGEGRILTITTPIPELPNPEGREPWNGLWFDEVWPGFALMVGSIRYVSGWGKHQLNYRVGQTVLLENETGIDPEQYELFAPQNETMRLVASNGAILFPFSKRSGAYRLRGAEKGVTSVRGFAINLSKEDLFLDRVENVTLDSLIGKDKYRIARQKEEVESSVGEARFGSELYPFLMLVLACIVVAEQFMSSRFYSIRV